MFASWVKYSCVLKQEDRGERRGVQTHERRRGRIRRPQGLRVLKQEDRDERHEVQTHERRQGQIRRPQGLRCYRKEKTETKDVGLKLAKDVKDVSWAARPA